MHQWFSAPPKGNSLPTVYWLLWRRNSWACGLQRGHGGLLEDAMKQNCPSGQLQTKVQSFALRRVVHSLVDITGRNIVFIRMILLKTLCLIQKHLPLFILLVVIFSCLSHMQNKTQTARLNGIFRLAKNDNGGASVASPKQMALCYLRAISTARPQQSSSVIHSFQRYKTLQSLP